MRSKYPVREPAEDRAPAETGDAPVLTVGFILLPNFTLLPFAAFVDCLRLAADEGDRSRQINCSWTIMAPDLRLVRSSSGVEVQPSETFVDPARFDYIVVVGGILHRGPQIAEATLTYLQAAATKRVSLVGVCTGTFALIRAGLMSSRRCCVSWYHYQDLTERFPDVVPVADQLFVVDGDRITCAGGTSAADLAAWLVERHCGRAWAQKSLHIMLIDRARPAKAAQPQPPVCDPVEDNRVRRAMLLIEQHLNTPLSADELAQRVNISRRQLERAFREQVGLSPQQFARQLRLHYGLWLLANSEHTITEIGQECGFSDTAHFSRQFRVAFGRTPTDMRNGHAGDLLAELKPANFGNLASKTLSKSPPS